MTLNIEHSADLVDETEQLIGGIEDEVEAGEDFVSASMSYVKASTAKSGFNRTAYLPVFRANAMTVRSDSKTY